MHETVKFRNMLYEKYSVNGSIGVATPLLGTELYEEDREKGYLTKNILNSRDFAEASQGNGQSLIHTEDFDPFDIAKVQEYANESLKRINYRLALRSLPSVPKRAADTPPSQGFHVPTCRGTLCRLRAHEKRPARL